MVTYELFDREYKNSFKRTFMLLRRLNASLESAEELTQAAWVRGWEARAQLREEGQLVQWINSIAVNMFRASFRTFQAREIQVCTNLPEPQCFQEHAPIDVRRVMQRMHPRHRTYVKMRMEGWLYTEIAAQEETTAATIRTRMHRALAAAKKAVA